MPINETMRELLQTTGRVLVSTRPTTYFKCAVCGRSGLPVHQCAGMLPVGDPVDEFVPVCLDCYLAEWPELYHRHHVRKEARPGDDDLIRRAPGPP